MGIERIPGADKGCRKQFAKQSEMHHCIAVGIIVWYSPSSGTFRASRIRMGQSETNDKKIQKGIYG